MSSEIPQSDLNGTKVLVIDDSEIIRRTAVTLLTNAGCQVTAAINGFEALAKIVDTQPDIIFIDTVMPHLDGYQTCTLLKHNPRYSSIPIVLLSSKEGLFDRARARIAGSDQYLAKPFTRDELFAAVRTHLPHRTSAA